MAFVVVIAVATCASLALTPLAGKLAWKCAAVALPDGDRKRHGRPTPLWGGGAVYLALLAALAASQATATRAIASLSLPLSVALSAGMLCLLGCCDDLYDVRARWKLVGQIAATLPVVLAGHYVGRLVAFGCSLELGWLGVFWTIGWLVLGINALNLLDGADGLASLVGILTAVLIAGLAGTSGRPDVALVALALAAALLGFLGYNLPPARIYLGDCGSMLLGFILALLALEVSDRAPATANLAVAVMLLWVPLIDTGLAILRRTLSRRSIMAADRAHVHHRLLDRGISIWGVLGLLGGLCLVAGAIAWAVAASGRELTAAVALGAVGVFLVRRRLVGYEEWRLATRLLATKTRALARRRFWQRLLRWPPAGNTQPETALPRRVEEGTVSLSAGAAKQMEDARPADTSGVPRDETKRAA